MSVYLRGRVYWYERMIDGRRYFRSLNIRKGQELLLSDAVKQMDLQITAEHLGLPYRPPANLAFSAFAEKYLAAEKDQVSAAEWTKKGKRLAIVRLIWGSTPLSSIGRDDVTRLERHLLDDRKVSETTVNRYFEILRHMFRRAIDEGLVKESPVRYFTPFREDGHRRALTIEELRKIVEAAGQVAKTPQAPNFAPIQDVILFGLHTGARLSEIINLRLEYIRDPESIALIPISETKSRRRSPRQPVAKVKTIPLNAVARAAAEKYRAGRTEGLVFPFARRHPDVIHLAIVAVREKAGVPDFTFHQLRHTFVTEAAERFGLSTARNIVSHADLKTTARYTHPHLEEIKGAVTKLTTVFPGYTGIKVKRNKKK